MLCPLLGHSCQSTSTRLTPQRPTAAAGSQTSQRTDALASGCYPEVLCTESYEVNEDDINVLALVKGRERYIFLFDDSQRADALRTLGRFASNTDLSFSWYDAAVLSQKVRQAGPASKSLDRISLGQPEE